MTYRERHEIAKTVKYMFYDECDEIRNAYEKVFGNFKGFRKYLRTECTAFWTDFNPYLDEPYLDYAHFVCGGKIINYDDCWCFVRDGLKELMTKG